MREKRNGTDNLLGWCPRRFHEALCPKWSEAEKSGNVLEWFRIQNLNLDTVYNENIRSSTIFELIWNFL
jgi:hypothetical protein